MFLPRHVRAPAPNCRDHQLTEAQEDRKRVEAGNLHPYGQKASFHKFQLLGRQVEPTLRPKFVGIITEDRFIVVQDRRRHVDVRAAGKVHTTDIRAL